jgi:hypothetical protein
MATDGELHPPAAGERHRRAVVPEADPGAEGLTAGPLGGLDGEQSHPAGGVEQEGQSLPGHRHVEGPEPPQVGIEGDLADGGAG